MLRYTFERARFSTWSTLAARRRVELASQPLEQKRALVTSIADELRRDSLKANHTLKAGETCSSHSQCRSLSSAQDDPKSGVYEVLSRNKEWADRNKQLFRPLSEGQSPRFFVVSCSDSRCPSEKVMGFNPGECFTVRNIANCVMNGDLSINAATQFAVEVLGVQDILVVGHADCGGIKAAMTRQSFGTTIDMYVRHVRDVYRQHITEIDSIQDPTERLNCLIRHHIVEQCINLFKSEFSSNTQ